ncbi:MAG: hypothetical protein M1454_05285 [Candidatus Thermoplasmatota archaeon]|nr:hypothetical protein [Candidatus Thermoplasmatota archaeon]MCL5731244.1 hypothetical protein [Candidatus Thermoplasmatota archaeon]
MRTLTPEILKWFSEGEEDAKRLINLKWEIKEANGVYYLSNEKVPFALLLSSDDGTVQLMADTGIETAVLELRERLSIYRTLLIINRRVDLVKFMLDGLNENVFARVDLEKTTLTKDIMDEALNVLLSALYYAIKALKMEEQFSAMILERIAMMIEDMEKEGKSRDEIKTYLVTKAGIDDAEAGKLIDEVLGAKNGGKESESMYR